MAEKETFSVRLDPERREQLDRLAESMDRPRSYLVNQAIDQFLDYHAWKLERVEEGRSAAERGELVAHDEVFDRLRGRYAGRKRE